MFGSVVGTARLTTWTVFQFVNLCWTPPAQTCVNSSDVESPVKQPSAHETNPPIRLLVYRALSVRLKALA